MTLLLKVMSLKFNLVLVVFFSMDQFVNGGKSLWEVPEPSNRSHDEYFLDDMWIHAKNYPTVKSTLIAAALWPGRRVPYELDNKFFSYEKDLIKHSMAEISRVSCITFVERRNDEENFLSIKNLHNCASNIGYMGSSQILALSTKMCMKKGIIIHELLHALGFVHEHCRSDRDDYITVDKANIERIHWYNYEKYETGLLDYWDEPYDFNSIMHYDAFTYAKDKSKPVIEALIPGANLDIREELSPADIRKLNKLYGC